MKSDNLNISFTGESHNSIDQKNRLSIPAKYRKALSPVNNNTFVLTRGFDQCLVLYPLNEWKKVEIQLADLSSIKSKHRNFSKRKGGSKYSSKRKGGRPFKCSLWRT